MSNALAIAAVTATIQGLIAREGIEVTTVSPDRAAADAAGNNRVNVFLYHTMPNAHWRNAEIPQQTRSGERGHPPLALNLYYLLTAYGNDGSDLAAHRVLGLAMRALHDRPVLLSDDIRNVTRGVADLRDTDLDQQFEKVRITPDPLSLEDLSRLWSTFQTQYRVSAAYQASVVLIESQRPTKAPLPVLKRGEQNQGVQTNLGAFDPVLGVLEYRPNSDLQELPAAKINDLVDRTITVRGKNLPTVGTTLVIRDAKKSGADDIITILQPTHSSDTELTADLLTFSNPPANTNRIPWTAGLLSLELTFPRAGSSASGSGVTNALPLAIAPQLQMRADNQQVLFGRSTEDGKTLLELSCEFALGERRRVYLILSSDAISHQIPQLRDEIGTGQLRPQFDISNVEPGEYWLRLRVDGVDSLMMTRVGTEFVFDERFKVQL